MATDAPTPRDLDAPQLPLPFDDGADDPIPFALTARARRTVAPHDLPRLRVLTPPATSAPDEDASVDDRSDTRPARARALARAGLGTAAIARQLRVDELLVRAWTGASSAGRPATRATDATDDRDEARTAFELARAQAAVEVRDRLATDPQLAAGLGLLAGIASVDPHAVTVTTSDETLAAASLRWLLRATEVDHARVRVVLRIASSASGDLVRHRWARALDLPAERVVLARWPAAPSASSVEALVRVADPAVAATFAGWRDAFLAHATGTADADEDAF